MAAIVRYDWPGNVRELENAVERAFILSGNEIGINDLPAKVRVSGNGSFPTRDDEGFRPSLDEMERRYILEVLASCEGDKAKTALILGVDLSTLYRKLKRYEEI
jgi:DNA-binding NtrC family response regulator